MDSKSPNTPIKGDRSVSDSSEPPAADLSKPRATDASKKASGTGKPQLSKNNVKQMRIKRMISKAELARRANLSVLTIDRVEKGYGCRMDTKRKILEALGLNLDDRVNVFGDEE